MQDRAERWPGRRHAPGFIEAITRSIGEGVYAVDAGGRLTFLNPAAEQLLGWSEAEVLGRSAHDLFHSRRPDGTPLSSADCPLTEVVRSGAAVRIEDDVFTRRDGEQLPVSLSSSPILDDGRIVGSVIAFRDMTEVRRAASERAAVLAGERDRLLQLLEVSPEAITIADREGRLYAANAAARAIWGQAEEGGAGVPLTRCRSDGTPYPPDEVPLTRSVMRGEVVKGEQVLLRNEATGETTVLVSSAPLRDPDGSIIGGVAFFHDITHLKELERQKDAFLAAVSHDLKNPLTTIKALAQMLRRRAELVAPPNGPRLAEGLGRIDHTASRMVGMINELLDVSRLEMGRALELDRRPTDLVALAQRVAADQQQTTDRHRIAVRAAVPGLEGVWDADRLERVLANLLSNAIKYTPDGGEIVLRLSEDSDADGRRAIVVVEDRGLGIPTAELPHVFEGFYRGSNVTGQIRGTGLGLAGARRIVEQHGGTIDIESQEGRGTRITVRLPVVSEEFSS